MIGSGLRCVALACATAVAVVVSPAYAADKQPTSALERFFERFGGDPSQIRLLSLPGNAERKCDGKCDVYVMAFEYKKDDKRECASFIPLNALRFALEYKNKERPELGKKPVGGRIDVRFHVIGFDRDNQDNFVFADRDGMKAVHIELPTGDVSPTYPTPLPPNFSGDEPKDLSEPGHVPGSHDKTYKWKLEGDRDNTLAFKVFIKLKVVGVGADINCEPFDPLIVNQ